MNTVLTKRGVLKWRSVLKENILPKARHLPVGSCQCHRRAMEKSKFSSIEYSVMKSFSAEHIYSKTITKKVVCSSKGDLIRASRTADVEVLMSHSCKSQQKLRLTAVHTGWL